MSAVRRESAELAVLLVEDDEDDVVLTRALLGSIAGVRYQVDWARTVEEVERRLDERVHDVCLVDYRLGRTNGLDIARRILSRDELRPVIMLTGHFDREVDVRAAELGIADYLVKGTIDAAGLERSIRYAISHQQALRALASSEERYALAVAGANDGLWDWDLRSQRMYFSPRWKSMLGHAVTDVGDGPDEWFGRVHPEDRAAVREAVDDHLEGRTDHFECEHRVRTKGGPYRWMLTRGLAVRGVDGRPSRFAGSQTDITQRKETESRLQHDALHDALTGLPNRVLFVDRLMHAMRRAARTPSGGGMAVLFLDLDRFKLVNDSLGHTVGDRLLIDAGQRLEAALRPGDTVARLGGDEFLVLLEDLHCTQEAGHIADRILADLAAPFRIEDRELYLSGSIGIAIPDGRGSAADVIRDADAAMYRAKAEGKGRHAMFDAGLHETAVARLELETRLRRGLGDGRDEQRPALRVVYQPVVDVGTRRVQSFEALARWQDADGLEAPDRFIPVAEETGLISALGRTVLREACAQLARWRADGAGDLRMAVNISGRQLLEPNFASDVAAALADHDLHPADLRLEITETEAAADPEPIRRALVALYERVGVQAHIDDFGTGASSLTFLHGFPGDALKIDRSFVAAMQDDEGAYQIVKAIVGLAHNLGMDVIAEGVETTEQYALLRELGCEFAQGFLFAPPLDARDASRLLASRGQATPAASPWRAPGPGRATTS